MKLGHHFNNLYLLLMQSNLVAVTTSRSFVNMDETRGSFELSDVSPSKKDGNRKGEDISQREYEDRIQLARLGKKSVLKVSIAFIAIPWSRL